MNYATTTIVSGTYTVELEGLFLNDDMECLCEQVVAIHWGMAEQIIC